MWLKKKNVRNLTIFCGLVREGLASLESISSRIGGFDAVSVDTGVFI